MTPINLNADMAESHGAYTIGDDASLMDIVQTANVACGFHGGDPTVMADTIEMAKSKSVSIGAHPGFNDLWGFGRRQIRMNTRDLENMVAYQIAALQGMAAAHGHPITHVKPHGAMNNMAAVDRAYADAIARAIKAVDASLIFVAIARSELVTAGEALGLTIAAEVFADRTYTEDGQLTPRTEPDAMIRDHAVARDHVFRMVEEQAIFTKSGKRLETPVHTVCIHGDEPTAVAVGRSVREAIEASGTFRLTILPDMPLGQ